MNYAHITIRKLLDIASENGIEKPEELTLEDLIVEIDKRKRVSLALETTKKPEL
ncbi:hypothetical protein ACFQ1M_09745 [Sungkyunkwania multivorans]|uniref:Uncharacterized protein n=1 Tax=Sungkyunkwania multivorans TaxID=1173618 RepID=A0ABW3D050_9FLAO